ncbi:MAG: hypothetical protein IJM68_00965 [Synergistaceae bacterium]|nr:hypothetical protein [Synergistaceae bacterium]
MQYVQKIFSKRPYDIHIIAHSKFIQKAKEIKSYFPAIKIALRSDIHAKIALIEPNTVWLSSGNFGKSGWYEFSLGMHNDKAFEYLQKQFQQLYKNAKEVKHEE